MHRLDGGRAALVGRQGAMKPVSRTILRHFLQNRQSCSKALGEAREELCDTAEGKLFELVEAGDYRAITFVLSTRGKNRGYVLPKDTTLSQDTAVTVIESVNIVAVPRGKFLPRADEVDESPGRYVGAPAERHLTLIDGTLGDDDEGEDPTLQ